MRHAAHAGGIAIVHASRKPLGASDTHIPCRSIMRCAIASHVQYRIRIDLPVVVKVITHNVRARYCLVGRLLSAISYHPSLMSTSALSVNASQQDHIIVKKGRCTSTILYKNDNKWLETQLQVPDDFSHGVPRRRCDAP